MPVPYNTISVSAEKNLSKVLYNSPDCCPPKGFSVGALFNYDVAGDANLSLTQLEISVAHTSWLGGGFTLTPGLMIGGGQRSFDPVNLFFDNQFNGKEFEPNSGEENFEDETKFLFDISGGLNLHYQTCQSRTSFDIGTGIFHLNRPKANFYNDWEIRLPSRLSIYGLGIIQLTGKVDLLINALGQFQGPYTEVLLGGGGRFYLKPGSRPGRTAIDVGLGYRLEDAVILNAGLNYKMWQFGLSYDINTSGFERATNGNGGLEFSLGYIIHKPLPAKVCPIQY
ncbi:MAG: hypothetical protein DHS20C18_19790 [Saprospiraceae bacterium]|nr:MAG: hypothetical protein DHS20C18_19790 [Saprospiraceae bacterium]